MQAANFNDPKQTVIAGTKAGVDKACELLKAAGAKRALPLAVSAPFHSALMKPAAERLRERLATTPIDAPCIPVIDNVDVRSESEPAAIRDALYRQAFGAVRWVETIQAIRARGITHIFECGPGKVLAGMVKRIDAGRGLGGGLRPGLARRRGGAAAMSDRADAPAQVALVTGASRGIGRAIALALAAKGFRVVGTATTEAGAAAIGEALAAHDGCRGIVLDVNDGDAVGAAIDAVVRDSGALHVLVNNAGITRDTLSMRMKDDDWNAVLATNLTAVFRASRAALRPMMKQRYGRIVNITSVVGASGNPGQANYAAAKAGVAGMTRSLAREVGSRGITVNCVAPGFIETDMTRCARRGAVGGAAGADPARPARPGERSRRTRWRSSPRRKRPTSRAPNCTSTAAC